MLEGINQYPSPHEFIGFAYQTYKKKHRSSPSINGTILEFLVCETLVREGIVPFFYQARFTQVPNADFDIVLYDPVLPVVLSVKTSLRERYKQAVLEGVVLQQVYRKAESHLLTLSGEEAVNLQRKIEEGSVTGMQSCVRLDTKAYDDFLAALSKREFSSAEAIMPIVGTPVSSS